MIKFIKSNKKVVCVEVDLYSLPADYTREEAWVRAEELCAKIDRLDDRRDVVERTGCVDYYMWCFITSLEERRNDDVDLPVMTAKLVEAMADEALNDEYELTNMNADGPVSEERNREIREEALAEFDRRKRKEEELYDR